MVSKESCSQHKGPHEEFILSDCTDSESDPSYKIECFSLSA